MTSTTTALAKARPTPDTLPKPGATPFVSVIVPVYNDAERLMLCLHALEGQTYASNRYEVIVVDNASTVSIALLLSRFTHAVPEYEASPGSYAARNRGIARARGDILAFTDADCLPSPGWLQAGVEALQRGASVLAGRIDVFPATPSNPNAIELYEMFYAFSPQDHAEAGIAATANLFTRRKVMHEVGGFDAALKSYGDATWAARAVEAGYKITYCAEAGVRHPARRSLPELRNRYARFAGGHYDRGRRARSQLTRERLRAALMLAPPVRLAAQVVASRTLPDWRTKAGVIGVAYFARIAYLAEWARLEFGGASRRQ